MYQFRYLTVAFSLLIALMILVPGTNAQEDIVTNGSFETGDFTGWTRQSINGAGNWYIYSGTSTPVFSDPVLPPPDGESASVMEQEGPDSNILYQDIAVPPNGEYSCSVIVYLVNFLSESEQNYIDMGREKIRSGV